MNRIQAYVEGFLLGNRRWGIIRRLFVLFMLLLFSYLGYQAFHGPTISTIVRSWVVRQNTLRLIPNFLLQFYFFITTNFRFIWITVSAFIVASFIGAAYLSRVFGGASFSESLKYLLGSLFSLRTSRIVIRDGNIDSDRSDPDMLRRFGGPGGVVIEPGNVVVLEYLDRPSRVITEGGHVLNRFEKVKELQSDYDLDGREMPTLDERHGFIEKTSATSKDGIEVEIRDIHYRYRLRMEPGIGDYVQRTPQKPNPVSVNGVMKMAYNRTVRLNPKTKEPEVTPWHDLVNRAVEGAILDYVRGHQFDALIFPSAESSDLKIDQIQRFLSNKGVGDEFKVDIDFPRDQISGKILSKNLRNQIRNFGADLLWWDIGHISIHNPVVIQQLIDSWGALWEGRASVVRARGEAEMVRLRDINKAETQADLLMNMVDTLERVLSSIDPTGKSEQEIKMIQREKVRNIILAKTTQLLESIASGDKSN